MLPTRRGAWPCVRCADLSPGAPARSGGAVTLCLPVGVRLGAGRGLYWAVVCVLEDTECLPDGAPHFHTSVLCLAHKEGRSQEAFLALHTFVYLYATHSGMKSLAPVNEVG